MEFLTIPASAEQRFLRHTLPITGRPEQDRFMCIDEPTCPPPATTEVPANAQCRPDYSSAAARSGAAISMVSAWR